MWNLLTIAVLFQYGCLSFSSELKSFLDMKIVNSGFHREINYNLKFTPNHKNFDCQLLLVQHLPSSVYIDNDQLLNLKKLKKLKSFVPLYVDVELPTDSRAAPFSVYIYESLRKNLNMTLPIHFRYHSPSEKKFNRVEIESPTLYVSCPTHPTQEPTIRLPCENSTEILDFSKLPDASLCDFNEIEFSSAALTLSFLIPVGNINSYKFVLPITILVSWAGCFFLIYIIIKKSRQISKKLS